MVFSGHNAAAQSLKRLVMPGPVIRGHAKIEETCNKCHQPFQRTRQTQLCLACHKEVRSDITKKRGFHGRARQVRRVECKSCHTEHKGRNAKIVLLDQETFDHSATDFHLRGAHASLVCASCHKTRLKYRQAPTRCVDCHRNRDPHHGRLKENCQSCHVERSWAEVAFDHKKRTRYALLGKHKDVACKSCHPDEHYRNASKNCQGCHRINDVHRGRFGLKCASCHTPKGWKQVRFNHDRDTKYRLTGRHRSTACDLCHTKSVSKQKLKSNCFSCHQFDDVHKGKNGQACVKCHNTATWKESKFDHAIDTKFPLRGRHAKLNCESCHKGTAGKEKLGTRCIDCHRSSDVHKGQLGRDCKRCHNERSWTSKVRFDHDLVKFPLIGQHAVIACEECHASETFKGASKTCISCHRDKDSHKRRLGSECQTCHNPNGWSLWRFDHGKSTKFVLDGAHDDLKCEGCHTRPIEKQFNVSKICNDCHVRQDVHQGAFGNRCERCHTTTSFKEVNLRR